MKITHSTPSPLIPVKASQVKAGIPFIETTNPGTILMRLKPTGFLLNSTILIDVLNRADVVVCNLEKGTVYVIKGDSQIKVLNAELVI